MNDNRLLAVSGMVIKGEPVADIGADHALLSIYLLEQGMVPWVIASELNEGPFRRILEAVRKSSYADRIVVRKGNGLQVLEPGEVASVIIAGMGGDTIAEILFSDLTKAAGFKRFVFQPMSKPGVLRRELSVHGWPIWEEKLIKAADKYFIVFSASPGRSSYKLSQLEIDLGPFILKNDTPLKKEFLKEQLKKYWKAYQGILQANNDPEQVLLKEYEEKIKELEGIVYAGQS